MILYQFRCDIWYVQHINAGISCRWGQKTACKEMKVATAAMTGSLECNRDQKYKLICCVIPGLVPAETSIVRFKGLLVVKLKFTSYHDGCESDLSDFLFLCPASIIIHFRVGALLGSQGALRKQQPFT
jgi:hypothetical protein